MQCPFCRSASSAPHHLGNDIESCRSCGLLFRRPPACRKLEELYSQSWLDPLANKAQTGGTTEGLARIYAKNLAKSLRIENFSGLKIVDFGAGRGEMSAALAQMGAEVHCVDRFSKNYLVAKSFSAFSSLKEIPDGSVDAVVTIDTMEHLPAPWEELREFARIVRPGGWFYVCTLNTKGLNAILTRSHWREVKKDSHLFFFHARNFENMLRRCGYSDYRRLRWAVRYRRGPLNRFVEWVLQMSRMDGAIRYLIRC